MVEVHKGVGQIGLRGVIVVEPTFAALPRAQRELRLQVFGVNARRPHSVVVGGAGVAADAVGTRRANAGALLHLPRLVAPIVDFDVVSALRHVADPRIGALRAPHHGRAAQHAGLGARADVVTVDAREARRGRLWVAVLANVVAGFAGETLFAFQVKVFVAGRARRSAVARSVGHAVARDEVVAEVAARARVLGLRGAGEADAGVAPSALQVVVVETRSAHRR